MQTIDSYVRELNVAKTKLDKDLLPHFQALMQEGKEIAEENTPVDSGKLRSNWKYEQEKNTIRVYNDTPYAVNQEYGGVTPTGGVYSGSYMADKGATYVEKNIDNVINKVINEVFK